MTETKKYWWGWQVLYDELTQLLEDGLMDENLESQQTWPNADEPPIDIHEYIKRFESGVSPYEFPELCTGRIVRTVWPVALANNPRNGEIMVHMLYNSEEQMSSLIPLSEEEEEDSTLGVRSVSVQVVQMSTSQSDCAKSALIMYRATDILGRVSEICRFVACCNLLTQSWPKTRYLKKFRILVHQEITNFIRNIR